MDNNPVQNLLELAEQKFGELNVAEKTLFRLAQEKFRELRDSEYKLFHAIANGQSVDYETRTEEDDKPENASRWGEERTLRGDRLRQLCIEPEVWKLCLPEGISVSGAKIEDSLNLSFSDVEIPLRFSCCYFTEALRLQQARLRRLDLSGTYIASSELAPAPGISPIPTSIDAREISVAGSIFLHNGFQATGRVSLIGATIGGNLVCATGKFTNEKGDALFAQSVKVAGTVFLDNGFQAIGRVSLNGATIGGSLDCEKGTFTGGKGDALFAQSVNVTGAVLLRNGFQATGRVSFYGATIGVDLDCEKGTFTNEKGTALLAQSVNVTGAVLLRHGFQATGRVSLNGARIGGDLDCEGGRFTGGKGDALFAQNVNVTGAVLLRNGFQATGRVSFYGATIGVDLDCEKGTFTNEKGTALLAQSVNVTGAVLLRHGFQATGRVSLNGARIGGDLDCEGGRFTNEIGIALLANNADIAGGVLLRNGFQALGTVSLSRVSTRGDIDCSGGVIKGGEKKTAILRFWLKIFQKNKYKQPETVEKVSLWLCQSLVSNLAQGVPALIADDVDVKGNISLKGFHAQGQVQLEGANVGKTLQIAGLKVPKEMALNLQFAKVQTLEHVEDSFPTPGNLELNGLIFTALGRESSQKWDHQLKWLRLHPRNSFSSQPYEHLAKVLQSTGYRDEAIQVLIGREDDQLRYGNLSWFSKFWKRILGMTIAYGYRPQQAIYIAIGIVTVGAFLFGAGYQQGLITPTEKDCKPSNSQNINDCSNYSNYPRFNPLIYSLDVFLPIIDLRLKASWQPNANTGKTEDVAFHIKSGAWLRYYLWLHIILGWVLTTLWVAGFSGLVRNTNK